MALNLKDMMKKAEDKGIKPVTPSPIMTTNTITKPWQQESVLIPFQKGEEKSQHKANTKSTQTVHKEYTTPAPSDVDKTQTVHKRYTQRYTELDTKSTQTVHKEYTKQGFSTLVGIQRELTILIYRSCQNERSHISESLSLAHMAVELQIRKGSLKTTLIRLEEKSIIKRVEAKTGRGGWSKFEINESVFREMLQFETVHKLDTKSTQTAHKEYTKRYTEEYTSPSSSSSLNLITTTSEETENSQNELIPTEDKFQLKPEWELVDIEPLAFINFSKHHLIQIIRQGLLTPDLVQDSINAFAFDLQSNERGKGINSPIHYFMGILRKGQPYTPPDNYVSPKEQAIRKILEVRKREEELEKELQEAEFRKWLRETPQEEKEKIAGDTFGLGYSETNQIILAKLRSEFQSKIFKSAGVTNASS